jgi:nucleoside-diphosphate-sugar epimerase
MAKVLVVGCGDLGTEIALILASSGHELVGLRVSNKQLPNNLPCIQADVTNASTLDVLERTYPNIIVYCIAANAQSDDSYREHYVDGLRNILATQVNNGQLQHVFFVSSTRVYGQKTDDVLTENDAAIPTDFGGQRLLEAESLLKGLSCGGTVIRLSGIYGPGRLYLVNMAKDPSRWPKTNKWTNRIHRDDAARFIAFLCEKVIAGVTIQDCYIGTDDTAALQYDVLGWLASRLNVEAPRANAVDAVGGKRLSNQRMHDAGFQLTYPNYQLGYCEVLKNE